MTDKQQPFKMPEPVAWTLAHELQQRETTCRAHMWFSNPQNSAWASLFTADQVRAAYEQGLERAAQICDEHFELRSVGGFPREASTARALAKDIRNEQAAAPSPGMPSDAEAHTELGARAYKAAFDAGYSAALAALRSPVDQGEKDREDAERYRGLKRLAKEEFLSRARAASEIAPDIRTHWKLPILMCSGPVGGFIEFDDAVNAAIAEPSSVPLLRSRV